METAKPTLQFRQNNYEIQIGVIDERRLSISVIDSIKRIQFYERQITLEKINCNTVMKAFERTKKQITATYQQKHISQTDILEIKFMACRGDYLFKKNREVSQTETVRKSIDHLSKKIKEIKDANQKSKMTTYYGAALESKSFNSQNYETLASISLPKGKYILTLNFLLKAQNQWIYIYFNQGQSLLTHCGFYSPTTTQFIPQTLRKVHSVASESETVCFTTYCANSYPITIKNAIIVARPLVE